jgi:pimeloyl-ACP methyl ester carboxylesterase
MSTAFVNGAEIHYEIQGVGDPLVLVHAGIADRRMWDPQLEAFAERYRVIRYDLRGFGETAPVAGPYSHHDDLRALLDHLGVERASFVGCSMGGGVALDFALENPEATAALVLVCSAVGGFEPDLEPPREWDELVEADAAGDLERVSELEVRIWVDGPRRDPEAVDPAVRDLVREMNGIALRNEAAGLGEEVPLDPPAAERLHEVRCPTLVVVGELDQPFAALRADLLTVGVPGARKVTMRGTAHLPNMERSGEFNSLVLEFLSESSSGGRTGPV